MMKDLIQAAANGASSNGAAPRRAAAAAAADGAAVGANPIQETFRKSMGSVLRSYEAYYEEMQRDRDAHLARVGGGARADAAAAVRRAFDANVSALLTSLEAHLQAVAPPSFLPITITLLLHYQVEQTKGTSGESEWRTIKLEAVQCPSTATYADLESIVA